MDTPKKLQVRAATLPGHSAKTVERPDEMIEQSASKLARSKRLAQAER